MEKRYFNLKRKQTKFTHSLKPLSAFLELAHIFAGGEDNPDVRVAPKHVLGGLTKFVFSQRPSISLVTSLGNSFISHD